MSLLTVTTAATDLALLTAAELREAAGLDPADGSQDAALQRLGARVAATITRTCGVRAAGATPPTLRSEVLSEQFRPTSCLDCLILSRRPVTAIAAVTVDGTALAAAEYEADAEAGLLYRLSGDCRIDWRAYLITVAYTAGWATVPADLALAASKLVQTIAAEARRSDPNLRSEEIPGVISRTWWVGPKDDPAIPGEVLDLLAPYINPVIG